MTKEACCWLWENLSKEVDLEQTEQTVVLMKKREKICGIKTKKNILIAEGLAHRIKTIQSINSREKETSWENSR